MFWSRESLWFFNRIFFPLLKLYVFPGWCTFLFFAFFLFKCNNFLEVGMKKRKRDYSVAKIKFLIRKKLTRIFNIPHWIYSFGVVFKIHSLFTIHKSFMFLLYIFSIKCFNVFFWIDGKNHKTWVIDMFNFITSEYFFYFGFLASNGSQNLCNVSNPFKISFVTITSQRCSLYFSAIISLSGLQTKMKKVQVLLVLAKTWYEKM